MPLVAWSAAETPGKVGTEEHRVGRGRGCGEDWSEGLGWRRLDLGCPLGAIGAGLGRVITGRRSAGCEPGPDFRATVAAAREAEGARTGRGFGELPRGLWGQ